MSLADDLELALDPALLFERAFGMVPLDWQVDYLHETRPVVLTKARQVGGSLAAASLAITNTMFVPNTNAVIVSPTLKQSSEITVKARVGLRRLGVRLVGDSASMLTLGNGSRILSLPGTAKSVRGWSAKLLILDECAYIDDATIQAARALVAATGGRVVAQSTPAIEAGAFWELASSDDPGWSRIVVRADESGNVSPEFLAAERRALPPDTFAAEYECVFGRGSIGLFNLAQVDAMFITEEVAS